MEWDEIEIAEPKTVPDGGAQGELFGLGPPTLQDGDFVCILAGCTVPIILRQMRIEGPGRCDSNSDERNDCYMMFIGEAYVHGKREGEAVKVFEGKAWGTESETFNVE